MKKSYILYFSLCLFFMSQQALGVVLYRGDSRPPEVIFQHGFNTVGEGFSFDMVHHITGQSCYAGTSRSAFISLSRNEVASHDFADEGASATGASRYYVYEIESDRTYIDVVSSLQQALRHPDYNPSQRLRLMNMLSVAEAEDEVLSEFTILSSSVIRVHIYASPSGELVETRENPNFVNGTNTDPESVTYEHILQYIPPSSVDNSTNAWYASDSDSDSDSNSDSSDSSTACFMGGACSGITPRMNINTNKSVPICVAKKIEPLGVFLIFDGYDSFRRNNSIHDEL